MPERHDNDTLSGMRKAAILLLALDQNVAAELLRGMSRDTGEEVTREIANLSEIKPDLRQVVVSEFYNLVLARQYAEVGGLPYARTLLEKTLSPDEARKVVAALETQIY